MTETQPARRQPHPLMTAPEVAKLLRVHRTTVDNWRKAGLIGCVPLPGGGYRYRRAEVLSIVNGLPDQSPVAVGQ